MSFLNNSDIGARLKTIREGKRVSVRRFAMDATVDQSQYSKIEKAELPITENILDKLVTAYNLDKDFILFGTNVPRENVSKPHESNGKAEEKYSLSDKALTELLHNNKILAEANKSLADAHLNLSRDNNELIQLVKSAFNLPKRSKESRGKRVPKNAIEKAADELRHTGRTGSFSQQSSNKR